MAERKIVKQGIILTGIAILVSAISFGKEAYFASCFGVSNEVDAYVVAIQIPEIIFAFVWEAINAVVIPLYSDQLHKSGKQRADRFASNFLFLTISGIIALLILGEAFANQLVYVFSPGISYNVHRLAVEIIRIVLPMILFEGIIRITEGILNVQGSFCVPRASRGIRNIVNVLFMVILTSKFGINAAAYGMVIGFALECCFLLLYSRRFIKYKFVYDIRAEEMREAAKMMLPVVLAVGVNEINQVADKIVASFLSSGSISAINYATKLTGIIRTLLLANIITLMYPKFSKYVALKNDEKIVKSYLATINVTLMMGIPLLLGGVYMREDLVTIAFKRGAFDASAVSLVAIVFACYLVGALFVSIDSITGKLFTSFHDTKTPMINASIGVVINIVANIIFSRFWGAVGLAIATTLSAVVVSIRGLVITRSKLFVFPIKRILVTLIKCMIAACAMVLFIHFFSLIFNVVSTHMIFEFIIKTLSGAIVYFVFLKVMRIDELKDFKIKSFLKRNSSIDA